MRVPAWLPGSDGEELEVRRAWPRDRGRLIVEAVEQVTGRLRAGSIDAAGSVRMAAFGDDPVLCGLTQTAAQGELLVHRYGRRAVVRSGGLYVKLVAPGKAAAVASAHDLAVRSLSGTGIAVPAVVARDGGSVTMSTVPGVSFHDLGRRSGPEALSQWSRAWQAWGSEWPQFTAAAGPAAARPVVTRHTARDEAQTLSRWVDHAASFAALGVSDARLRRARDRVVEMLSEAAEPAVLAHRDLHDKQLLFDPHAGSVGMIDCDTLSFAEPALDLANLLVHLDFRVAQSLLTAEAASVGKHCVLDVAGSMRVSPGRLEAYAAATALRLACIYAFRPPYHGVAAAWFDALEPALGGVGPERVTAP